MWYELALHSAGSEDIPYQKIQEYERTIDYMKMSLSRCQTFDPEPDTNCDGLDDDCDGRTDEAFVDIACPSLDSRPRTWNPDQETP